MKAVITVTGKDSVGIIARVAEKCSAFGVNIIDISQSVIRDYFAMIMLADISGLSVRFGDFVDAMEKLGEENGLVISVMHEDIFNSMHRI
ncbi:MAG: ACT domain-containing protein [Clostridia bacterium]|nr:ACT domain-containing protein [Clostridia bacterium]MBP5271040.1 ACT domain-containing protein [Clostridia bacterium]